MYFRVPKFFFGIDKYWSKISLELISPNAKCGDNLEVPFIDGISLSVSYLFIFIFLNSLIFFWASISPTFQYFSNFLNHFLFGSIASNSFKSLNFKFLLFFKGKFLYWWFSIYNFSSFFQNGVNTWKGVLSFFLVFEGSNNKLELKTLYEIFFFF